MATISSAGIGSSLPVEDIITKLMSIEQRPVAQLKAQANVIETKISAFGSLQSTVSAFRDAALKLTQASTWGVTTATSSDAESVRVSTASGAIVGNYAMTVQNLASSQAAVSRTYESSASLVGEGTLRVEIGSFGQAGFAPQPNLAAMNISISATDSLATVRDKINAAGAGVSAVIVNDATGARLIISSTSTGSANAFRITSEGDAGLADLSYDEGQAGGLTRTLQADDARLNVNGVDIVSSSNTMADTIQGMTINLLRPTTAPVQLGVSQDTDALKASVQGFVDAYNALAKMLATQTKYDATTKTAGNLQGDSTAVALQRQMRTALTNPSAASGMFTSIRDIGLETQADGTIKVNDAKLTAALANQTEVRRLFANFNTEDDAANGVAQRLRMLGDAVLSTDGALSNRSTGLTESLTMNRKRQEELTNRLALTEARLRAQYTALDKSMSGLTALNAYISQQVTAWNKSTG